MYSRQGALSSDDGIITTVPHSPLEIPEIVHHILSYLQANPKDIATAGLTSRLFYQQAESILSKDPVLIIKGIKAIKREIAEVKRALKEAKTNYAFPATICNIPDSIALDDASILELQKLATKRIFTLKSLKYTRDAAFLGMPASLTAGVFAFALGNMTLAKEFVFLAIAIFLVILFLDKHVINDETHRDNWLPTPDNQLPMPSYNALMRRYKALHKLCDDWLNLNAKVKNEYIVILSNEYDGSTKDHLYNLWISRSSLPVTLSKRIEAEVTNRLFAP